MILNDIIRTLEEKHGCTVGAAIRDAESGEVFASHREELVFKSASLIKTPIMLWRWKRWSASPGRKPGTFTPCLKTRIRRALPV